MGSKIIYNNALYVISGRIQDLVAQTHGVSIPGASTDKVFIMGLLRLNTRFFYSFMKDQGHYLEVSKSNISLLAQINSFSFKKRPFISLAQSVANQ